jgi:hypothetical protein
MKQPLFIQNVPIDEKRISFIEKVVTRLARRARKSTTAIITPYPISACLSGESVNGEVLRYIFCASGKISKAIVALNKRPDSGVMISVELSNELGGGTMKYLINKKSQIIEPDIATAAGDKMIVSAEVGDPEKDKITELWVGMLWIPTVKTAHTKSFLIDSLDEEASKLIEG